MLISQRLLLLFTFTSLECLQFKQAVYDVQVKYGSKVPNRNVISTLFMYLDQSHITSVKVERLLLLQVIRRHCND